MPPNWTVVKDLTHGVPSPNWWKKVRIYDNRSRWIEARESGGQVTDGSNWMQLIAVSTLFHTCCSLLHTTTKQKCTHSQHYAYCRCASRLSFHYISFSYIITCPPVAKWTLSAPQPMGYCIALNPLQPYYNATATSKPIFINYILCRPVQIKLVGRVFKGNVNVLLSIYIGS